MEDNKKALESLHTALVQELLGRIRAGDAKPSDLNVARQFLKDNGIECIATQGSKMEDLMINLPDLDAVPVAEL